jgi:uncharacterized membrane protein
MDMVKISCPYCGLSKTIPRDKAPSKPVKANCPKCKHQFPIIPEKLQPAVPATAQQATETPVAATPSAPPPKPPTKDIDPHAGLGGSPESIGNLFTQSFGLFASRFFILFGLYLFMFVMVLVPGFIFGGGTAFLVPMLPALTWLVIPVGGLITTIVLTYFLFWGYGAFVHAVIDQGCGFGEALKRGREQVWSMCWALSLAGFMIAGGYFLFFIPGIIFGVWFLFVPFIIAVERERGMNALLKSFQYVQGHWWNTFLKLFILTLICGAIGVIPLIGWILSLVVTPFMLAFVFIMYYDLQQIKGTHPVNASTGRKAKWLAVGSIGYVVLPVVIIAMTGGAFFSTLMMGLSNSNMDFNIPQDQGVYQQQQQQPSTQQEVQAAPPPQKVLDSNATINVTKTKVDPGATLFINFNGIDEPAPKDWIALYRIDDPNDQYGEWEYLDSKSNGTVSFLAPGEPGIYEARLFLDWPSGGYHVVDRTEQIFVGDAALTPKPAVQTEKPASPLDKFRPKNQQGISSSATSFSGQVADPSQLYVYVYALNYQGSVQINGQEFYDIKGEKDMNYNYTGSGSQLKHGQNIIDVDYKAVPGDPWMTKVQVKIYTYDFDSGSESIIADWITEEPNGKAQIVLDLSP